MALVLIKIFRSRRLPHHPVSFANCRRICPSWGWGHAEIHYVPIL